MQESALVGSRLDFVLLPGQLVDNGDANLGVAQPVAQFRGQEPLDLLSAERTDAFEQWTDLELSAALTEEERRGETL